MAFLVAAGQHFLDDAVSHRRRMVVGEEKPGKP
jgi:hypothetical protein